MNRWAAVAVTLLVLPFAAPSAAVSQTEPVAIAARDLTRGIALVAADFTLADGSTADSAGPVGWVTRRVVSKGEILKSPAIAPADVIRSGDTVQLVWSDGAVELRLTGRAMNSAAVGESVNVRVDTKRRFEGTALASGEVRLDSPESGRNR